MTDFMTTPVDRAARKAAVVLSALGAERAGEVLGHLDDAEIARVAPALADPRPVTAEEQRRVLAEAQASLVQIELQVTGPVFARRALGTVIDDEGQVDALLARSPGAPVAPGRFGVLRGVPPQVVADAVSEETARIIALVLVHAESAQAADVLARLPEDVQAEVALAMGDMGEMSPAVIGHVEGVIAQRIEDGLRALEADEGVRRLADVLTRVDRSIEERVMGALGRDAAPMADRVREYMFVFDDLVRADEAMLSRAIAQTPPRELALAIKGASEPLRIRFFTIMGEQAAVRVQDELAALGAVLIRDIEEAQERITALVRRFEAEVA